MIPVPTGAIPTKYLLLTVITILPTWLSLTQAQVETGNRTLETCGSVTGCHPELSCLFLLQGGGAPCLPTHGNRCLCLPNAFIHCESSSECPNREACAKNPNSESIICLGCLFISDRDAEIVDPEAGACDSDVAQTPSPTFPPGNAFDLCSAKHPCTSEYDCLTGNGLGRRKCVDQDAFCRCQSTGDLSCEKPSDCSAGETCALDLGGNSYSCVSCAHLEKQFDLVANKSRKCDKVPNRDFDYGTSPNGLTLDLCTHDVQCQSPNKCLFVDGKTPCSDPSIICLCTPDEYTECKTSDDCPLGELCTQPLTMGFKLDRVCISRSYVEVVPKQDRKIFGNRDALTPPPGTGLTLESCKFDWNCTEPSRCTHVSDKFGGCAGRDACFCEPPYYQICAAHSDCVDGEKCVKLPGGRTKPYCVSDKINGVNFVDVDKISDKPPTELSGQGLGGDPCLSNSDCKTSESSPRVCRHISENFGACDGNRAGCYCTWVGGANTEECEGAGDCEEGEACTLVKDHPVGEKTCQSLEFLRSNPFDIYDIVTGEPAPPGPTPPGPTPPGPTPTETTEEPNISEAPIITPVPIRTPAVQPVGPAGETEGPPEDPQQSEEPICIEASALRQYREEDLVYRAHKRGAVLCDVAGSCATPGHIVVWADRTMMMKTYCALQEVSCSRRTAWVNSPRMRKAMRVPSRTHGLQFTALAARYESAVEEGVLAQVVHFGF